MTSTRLFTSVLSLPLLFVSLACGQDAKVTENSTAPPRLLVLVRREIQHGKASARQKLETNMARACNKLNVPNYWIDLEPITGSPEVLSFDPFDSYDHVERAVDGWNQIYASHPDLAKTQEEINALLTSERTIVAERRDDLSYREDTVDLSEARFMRVTELHFSPGHEGDFVQTFKILNAAYEKTKSEVPWVVYQTSMGSSSPGFLVFIPLANLKQNDAILPWTEGSLEFEGDDDSQQLQQIVRDTFATSESNLYAISPEMSHVAKKFVANVEPMPGEYAFLKPVQQKTVAPRQAVSSESKNTAGKNADR
jgi:hypothetical protein